MTQLTKPTSRVSVPVRGHAARRGFTLIELVVATVIAGILAGAATMSIRRLADGRDRSAERQAAVESVYSITRYIARDMANIVRDTSLVDTIVRINDTAGSTADQHDEVLLFCRSLRPVRPETNEDVSYRESDIHEVHYRLKPDPALTGVLWRRADPIVDENYQGGGVAVPLGVHIASLDFEAYNGTAWVSTWDSDIDGLPHALRVTCRGVIPSTGAQVVSRMSVAIDRIPLPFDPAVDETYDPSSDIANLEFGLDTGSGADPGLDFGGGGAAGGDGGPGRSNRRTREIRRGNGGGDRGGGAGQDGGGRNGPPGRGGGGGRGNQGGGGGPAGGGGRTGGGG